MNPFHDALLELQCLHVKPGEWIPTRDRGRKTAICADQGQEAYDSIG
jgi:hypothetical protein